MSRWWRAYDEAVDDPKLQCLSDENFRFWFNLCCVCSAFGGNFPSIEHLAFKLKMQQRKVIRLLDELKGCGLIDQDEQGVRPHNWHRRQYKSDVSTPRVKRFREQQRNVSSAVSETAPEYRDRIQIQKEKKEAAAGAAPDARTILFRDGLARVERITGKPPGQCRSLLGMWLRDVRDDCVLLARVLEDAETNRVAEPVAWITRALKPKTANGRREQIREEWDDARHKLQQFIDGAAGGDIRPAATGLLSRSGHGKP